MSVHLTNSTTLVMTPGPNSTEAPTGQFNMTDGAPASYTAAVTASSGLSAGQQGTYTITVARPAAQVGLAATASASTDLITCTAHGLTTGMAFQVIGTGPPAPLVADVVYYARVVDANRFSIAATAADATAGTPLIPLDTNGTAFTVLVNPFAVFAYCYWRNPAGQIGPQYTSNTVILTAAPQTLTANMASAPAGTVGGRFGLSTTTTGKNRNVVVTNSAFVSAGAADEILSASLESDMRRFVGDVPIRDVRIISGLTPSLLHGQIQYLTATLADALALLALYKSPNSVVLDTGSGNPLNGFKHQAVEQVRLEAEQAVPGLPCRWTVAVEVEERTS